MLAQYNNMSKLGWGRYAMNEEGDDDKTAYRCQGNSATDIHSWVHVPLLNHVPVYRVSISLVVMG